MSIFMNLTAMPSFGSALRPMYVAGLLALASLGFNSSVFAGGDADKGAEIATGVCASCHAATGVSEIATNPILAGQYESYIVQALKDYRSGARANAIMAAFATGLSDEDIENLAAYFSAQEGPLRTAPTN